MARPAQGAGCPPRLGAHERPRPRPTATSTYGGALERLRRLAHGAATRTSRPSSLVLGAVLLSDAALRWSSTRACSRPTSTAMARKRLIYQAMLDLHTMGEPVDALTLDGHLKQAGQLEAVGGRARSTSSPRPCPSTATSASTRRSSATTRCSAGCCSPPTTSRRGCTPTRPCRASSSTWPSADPRGRTGTAARTSCRSATCCRRGSTSSRRLSREDGDHRHGLGLRGARHGHGRLPARQPDHPRRAAVDGQVGAHGELRRACRAGDREGRRAVLARDVRVRARPALHRVPGLDPGRRPAQGPRARAALAKILARPPTGSPSRRSSSTTPPTSRCSTCAPRRAGCCQQRRRPRADPDRLPPAHARRRARRTAASSRSARSRAASRRSPRAQRAGPRPVAAQPQRRAAHRQAPVLSDLRESARSSRTPTS